MEGGKDNDQGQDPQLGQEQDVGHAGASATTAPVGTDAPGLVFDESPGEMALADEPAPAVAGEVTAEQAGIYAEPPKQIVDDAPQAPTRRPPAPDATNVRQDFETYKPLPKDYQSNEMLFLPADRPERLNAAIDAVPNVRLDDSVATREWARALNNGLDLSMIGDAFGGAVLRPDALWRQNVPSSQGDLQAKSPEFKETSGMTLTGERAILRMRHLLGQGSVIQIPMWHSGFWIALKNPSDGALLELDRRLSMEKISLGRTVHGLCYSNHNVYIIGWLVEFALNHVYDVTVEGWGAQDLRKHISSLDIPSLLWGLSALIWNQGFEYNQACGAEPEKCQHIFKELLDVSKLHWVDNRSLTEWQVAHMAGRNAKSKPDAVEKYRSEFVRMRPRRAQIDDKVWVTLKTPSIDEYLDSGNRWVAGIVHMVDSAFQLEGEDDVRNAHIDEQGKATTMRQFAHYVSEVHLPNDNNMVDRETVEMALSDLSSKPGLVDRYMNEIGDYINDSTIAVVAIPAHECPKCGTPRESKLPKFPQLLPIDVASTFFTLLVQKVQAIRAR